MNREMPGAELPALDPPGRTRDFCEVASTSCATANANGSRRASTMRACAWVTAGGAGTARVRPLMWLTCRGVLIRLPPV